MEEDDEGAVLLSDLSSRSGEDSYDEGEVREDGDDDGDVDIGIDRALSMSSSTMTGLLLAFCQSIQGTVLPVIIMSPLIKSPVDARSTVSPILSLPLTSLSLLLNCRWPLMMLLLLNDEVSPVLRLMIQLSSFSCLNVSS